MSSVPYRSANLGGSEVGKTIYKKKRKTNTKYKIQKQSSEKYKKKIGHRNWLCFCCLTCSCYRLRLLLVAPNVIWATISSGKLAANTHTLARTVTHCKRASAVVATYASWPVRCASPPRFACIIYLRAVCHFRAYNLHRIAHFYTYIHTYYICLRAPCVVSPVVWMKLRRRHEWNRLL